MHVQINKGSGITGTLRYIEGPGRDENGNLKPPNNRAKLLDGKNVGFPVDTPEDAKLAGKVMEYNSSPAMQANKDFKCRDDCLHLSQSWAKDQSPSDDDMRKAADGLLKALGMEKAMRVTYRHNDTEHPHSHTVANRVDPETGLTYNDYQQLWKAMRWEIEYERSDAVPISKKWAHEMADAAEARDHEKLSKLLSEKDDISRDHGLALGGHFGKHLGAERAKFMEYERQVREGGLKHEDLKRGELKTSDLKQGEMSYEDLKRGEMSHEDLKRGEPKQEVYDLER